MIDIMQPELLDKRMQRERIPPYSKGVSYE